MEKPGEFYRNLCTSETLRSGKKGFFHEFSDCVTKCAGNVWIRKSFGRLESEEDRVRSVFVEEKIKGVVVETLNRAKILFRDKDREIAKRRRLEGVEAASKGDYEKALLYLSQAVLRAPCTDPFLDREYDLPLALLERAKVFDATMEYDLALDDLNEAARYDLPEERKSEISSIKGRCETLLRESEWSVCRLNVEKVEKVKKVPSPRLTAGENPELPGASTLLEIRETLAAGKHAVAASEILPGDVLIVEPPLAACLLPEFFGTHCQHCFSRLRAPIGCPNCSSVAFCGKNCRDIALASYHKYECKILALLIGSGMSILSMLALRMITQEGPRKCREISRVVQVPAEPKPSASKSARRRCRRSKLREFRYGTGDKRAYELVTHRERRSPEDWLERSLMAVFLLKCLQRVDFFDKSSRDDEVPNDQEIAVGGLLLKNLQLLQFNAHELFETRLAREHQFRGSKPIYLGVAIYPTVARFNHDCYPAVTRYFVGRNIVIRATRVLKPGEVVAENYGPIFTKRSLEERQRELSGRYWFQCSCKPCLENWPQFPNLSNDMVKFKCPTSGCEKIHSRVRGKKGSRVCPGCKGAVDLADRIADLEVCEELYDEGFAKMEKERALEAIEIFREALIKFHRICVPPHRETHLAEIALSSCMASFGNTWRPPSL